MVPAAQHRRELAGRHVLITGASSGIGRAAAVMIAAHGATVFLLARRGEELDAVVEEIRALGVTPFFGEIIAEGNLVRHDPRALAR